MKLRPLSDPELLAVQRFAKICGPRWKTCLRDVWEQSAERNYLNTNDAALVHALRNSHGPAWLARFKLPAYAG